MNPIKIAGLLLILGFISVIAASIAIPPGLFPEPVPEKRLKIIDEYQGRWALTNLLFSLAGVLTAAGLAVFSLQLRGNINALLNWSALGAYAVGTVLWVILMVDRMRNPGPYFANYSFTAFTAALVGLLVLGLLLYGVAFLAAGFPGWLGYTLIGSMALAGLAALIFPGPFFSYFPPQAIFLFTLMGGIVLMGGRP